MNTGNSCYSFDSGTCFQETWTSKF